MKNPAETPIKKIDILIIVIGCICFGVIMGLRDLIPVIWIRMVIAAIAFIILGLTIGKVIRLKKKQKDSV
jgi:hypothetical protein